MRMAFGLVGLLVSVAILVYVWSFYTAGVATSGSQARDVAEQIAGVESSGLGGRASDWIKLTDYAPGGKLQGMTVSQVAAGSSIQSYFGIKAGDRIINVGPQSVKDIGDADMARALIAESYQRRWALVVMRGNERLELPQTPKPSPITNTPSAAPTAAVPANAPGATPAATPPAQPKAAPLQRQLDLIRGAGEQ